MPSNAITQATKLGMSMRFEVVVDNVSLGSWATCKGLSLEIKVKAFSSGGHYDSPIYLLEKEAQYKPIVLERAVTTDGSKALWEWLQKKTSTFEKGTASITLMDHQNKPVTKWELMNVFPTKWEGPALDAAGKKIAIEKLTLQHEGFSHAGGVDVHLDVKA